jgi:hypothetical protein
MSELLKDCPDLAGDATTEEDPAKPELKQPQPDAGQPVSPADTGAGKGNSSSTNDGLEVDARTRANRENAQKSTGPRTPAGREASSRNAVKHGLFAADITKHFRSEEESERYQRFIDGIVKDIAPVLDLESILARRAADIQFRLEALRTAEFKVYAGGALLNDTMEELLERSKNVIGLASLYDARFQRAFSKTMEDLSRAQKSRQDRELHALEQLKGIALAHLKENATFDPAKFGFVISRDFVFNQAHLANAKKLASFCTGHDMMEKKVVDYVAKVPPKAA